MTATCCVIAVAACSAAPSKVAEGGKKRSKEYFAESEYGVKASPRVSKLRSNLPRGGGRDQLGKPYQVRGKWYHPKEDPDYRKVGLASWYGDAFHGRLTANGEVYDMTHLTAAHPTMPLPSYARVTNKSNGSSVIVRVNDRGPFAHGRVIDLSRRAAEMLDYKNSGVAQVEVEFVGRAPLHGQDEQYLMASYKPAGGAPGPSDGLPTGVMIAMNGPTPSTQPSTSAFSGPVPSSPVRSGESVPFPGELRTVPASLEGDIILPAQAPVAPLRPSVNVASLDGDMSGLVLSYADSRVSAASAALDGLANRQLTEGEVVDSYVRSARTMQTGESFVALGTFGSREEAGRWMDAFAMSADAKVEIDPTGKWFGVTLRQSGDASLDDLLQQAWSMGAADAMVVRD